MAIRVNDRHLSDIEYENTYGKVYEYLTAKIKRLPKRYSFYLSRPFNESLNDIYNDISKLTRLYICGKRKSVERYRLCCDILKEIESVISLSYTYWSLSGSNNNEIKYINKKQRKFWAGLINKEIALIVGVMDACNTDNRVNVKIPFMNSDTKKETANVIFLNNITVLLKIVYSRAIHLTKNYQDATVDSLIHFARSALYYAKQGNGILVDGDEKKYNTRKKYFSEAIGELYSMNRPIKELSFNDIFSENELGKICNLVTDTIKILKSVQEFDANSFSNR